MQGPEKTFALRFRHLLLIQHEIREASSTQGLNMLRTILQDGAEIKDGCFTLTQQGVTPGSLQQRVHCLPTFEIQQAPGFTTLKVLILNIRI